MVEETWLQIRIDRETKEKLDKMAKATERDMSKYLRWLIRREYEVYYLPRAAATLPEAQGEQS